MIELTPAEVRQRYRKLGYDLPEDKVLSYRSGTPEAGAVEWLKERNSEDPDDYEIVRRAKGLERVEQ